MRFDQFDLSEPILRALEDQGYEHATPIQEGTIEHLLRDRDVVGQAQTGTGKTAAFMLPILERVDPDDKNLQALVLTPTRELCLQVADAARGFSKYLDGVTVLPVYGGSPIREQMDRLARGPQVVVGTPGRVLDLLGRGKMHLADTRMVVLDEADEMLSMGFIDDVRDILRRAPWGRQTALFSATMPEPIRKLADEELHSPRVVTVTPETLAVERIEQRMIEVEPHGKLAALDRVLQAERPKCALVFARTKLGAARLTDDLLRKDYRVRALHGDLSQSQRDSVMISFRAGRVPLLVATDVASRGLDVSQITHVINYDLPDDAEVYVHRIGRTGRVGRDGAAISLVSKKEARKLADILALTGRPITPWRPPGEDHVEGADATDVPKPSGNGSGPVEGVDGATRDHAAGRADRPRRRRRARRGARNPSSPSAPTANTAPSNDSATSTPPSG